MSQSDAEDGKKEKILLEDTFILKLTSMFTHKKYYSKFILNV